MRRAYIWIAGCMVLAACATPRAQCEARVDSNIKALKQAIATSEANLARGYAIETEVTPRLRYGLCVGGANVESCLKTEYDTKKRPVAIDLEEEQRKLASAKRRLQSEERQRASAFAECAANYPDS
ncbi:MAG: hypothetical protein JXQ85_08735 [Cognatishimia sp.]|uniref:hypothetical protein n=1 Tax=Cognatishimia sp. TaxID=2211648 RepID=UPI003B8C4645